MGQALRPLFAELTGIADGLTRALDPSLSRFGSALYTCLFQAGRFLLPMSTRLLLARCASTHSQPAPLPHLSLPPLPLKSECQSVCPLSLLPEVAGLNV